MVRRKKHVCKEIEAAILFAESRNCRYQKAGKSAHAWGRLLCGFHDREGCALSVWSTPRNPEMHAKQIIQRVKHCPHNE